MGQQALHQAVARLGQHQQQRVARAGHRQVFGPHTALRAQQVHVGPGPRQLRPHQAHQALVSAHAQQPQPRRLGQQVGGRQQGVAAQRFEGARQAVALAAQVRGDGVPAGRTGANRLGAVEGRRQVALFTGLQAHLVEVGITQALEQPGCRGLGHARHAGQLGGRVGQQVVGAVEQQLGQLAFALRQLLEALLDRQGQAGGHVAWRRPACRPTPMGGADRMACIGTDVSCNHRFMKQ